MNHFIINGPELNFSPSSGPCLGEKMIKALQKHGDRIAMVDYSSGIELTYSTLLSRSNQVASFLTGTSSIAVASPNSLDFFLPVLGALFSGAVCATMNHNYNSREFDHAIKICNPEVIFVTPSALLNILEIIKLNPCIHQIVVIGNSNVNTSGYTIPIMTIDDILSRFPPTKNIRFPNIKESNKDHVTTILFSSGTTGLSKGVELTDCNLLTIIYNLCDSRFSPIVYSSVTIGILPFFHGYGFGLSLTLFFAGAKQIVIDKFNIPNVVDAIEKYKVTNLYLVPAMLVQMIKYPHLEKYNFKSLKSIICGAAPVGIDVMKTFKRLTGFDCIIQGYGCTEATMVTHMETPKYRKTGSAGKLLPGLQCKIVDLETGKPLGANKRGEICLRGPSIMKGYCGNISATLECLEPDGFLHTGDVGYYDEEGFFFVVDRIKELIKCKGYQVPPAELENLLLTHPAIKDAAVIGIEDKDSGEVPMAFIVMHPEYINKITTKEIEKFVEERVINYKRLRGGARIVESIPKNASGKILRRVLKSSLNKSKI